MVRNSAFNRPEREVTDRSVVMDRRAVLKKASLAAGSIALAPALTSASAAEQRPTRSPVRMVDAGRPQTARDQATTYNNYYEFSTGKNAVHTLTAGFSTRPWTLEVRGLCERPTTFDVDTLMARMPQQERIYRFRCVEGWAMTVPWTGFPLSRLLDQVRPLQEAKFVRFVSFANGAPGIEAQPWYPWPYHEALTIEEAAHPLTLMATGLYGEDLPTQNGAPLRLVVPWKYGFKSAKALVRIELVARKPDTFWNSLNPQEYGFYGNVDPQVAHPRWSQASERLLDSGDRVPTLPFNGYGELVASLYSRFEQRRADFR